MRREHLWFGVFALVLEIAIGVMFWTILSRPIWDALWSTQWPP